MTLHSYLKDELLTARDPDKGKPWGRGNHTRLFAQPGDVIAVLLHGHQIATVRPDSSVILDSCGWKTVTTRDRINEVIGRIGWRLASDKRVWYVWRNAGRGWFEDWKNVRLPFEDGCILYPDGAAERLASQSDLDKLAKSRSKIKAYAKEYVRRLDAGEIKPSAGDCLYCSFGKMDGHLSSHVDESYYTGNLLANVANDDLYGRKFSPFARSWMHLKLTGESAVSDLGGFIQKQVQRALEAALLHYILGE